MANYYGQCRSNCVRVKDVAKFKKFCQRYRLEAITDDIKAKASKQRYGFLSDESIPTGYCNAKGDWIDTDFLHELSKHLVKGEVAVIMEVGSEKMRYLIGYACAVAADGGRIEIALNEIYQKAKETFGVEPSRADTNSLPPAPSSVHLKASDPHH